MGIQKISCPAYRKGKRIITSACTFLSTERGIDRCEKYNCQSPWRVDGSNNKTAHTKNNNGQEKPINITEPKSEMQKGSQELMPSAMRLQLKRSHQQKQASEQSEPVAEKGFDKLARLEMIREKALGLKEIKHAKSETKEVKPPKDKTAWQFMATKTIGKVISPNKTRNLTPAPGLPSAPVAIEEKVIEEVILTQAETIDEQIQALVPTDGPVICFLSIRKEISSRECKRESLLNPKQCNGCNSPHRICLTCHHQHATELAMLRGKCYVVDAKNGLCSWHLEHGKQANRRKDVLGQKSGDNGDQESKTPPADVIPKLKMQAGSEGFVSVAVTHYLKKMRDGSPSFWEVFKN